MEYNMDRKSVYIIIALELLLILTFSYETKIETVIEPEPPEDDNYDFMPFPEHESSEIEKSKWTVGDLYQKIRFFLIISSNFSDSIELKIGKPKSFKLANFDKTKPLKFLIHGFMGQCGGENFPGTLINAYYRHKYEQDFNLICVDWRELSHFGSEISMRLYQLSVSYALVVGQRLAQFIKFLKDQQLTGHLKEMHLVAYSLGAHVAGFAGYHLHKHFDQRIGRITGLDPAGPLYDKKTMDVKLDRTDADFVDIIHTNAGKLGTDTETGHVDFYPNGGKSQPQCVKTGDYFADMMEEISGICSHRTAPKYYARSILIPFKACKCDSWESYKSKACGCQLTHVFGEYCKPGLEGRFYLSTRPHTASTTTASHSEDH